MLMAERLVQGMDVWINTPRRPWEASGTSGMKVLVNGGLNLSELDGWWAEAYSPEVGWALGDGKEHDADPAWDDAEAESLYDLLEREVIPAFYSRDERGIPPAGWLGCEKAWPTLRRASRPIAWCASIPRSITCRLRLLTNSALPDGGQMGVDLLQWQRELARHWSRVRFGELSPAKR